MGIKNVLAIELLKIAINRTSPKTLQERLREEWQAHLDALPDGLPKLRAAAGFLRSTFHQENENLRLYIFMHGVTICLIFFMHALGKIDYPHMLSACGIVLGVFGTGVLCWEPAAINQNLEFISDEITYLGSSKKLSREAISYITFFAVLGAMQACAYSYLIVQGLVKNNLQGLPPALTIGLVCIVYACPSFGTYVLAKMQRRQCSLGSKK
jgi:hypothetical protein